VAQFEGGDVGAGVDFVGGIHAALGGAVGLGILYLWKRDKGVSRVGLVFVGVGEGFSWKDDRGGECTSISRKFSGGPYISSKVWERDSGIDCILKGGSGKEDDRAELGAL
jgi:hypothetical protein